VVSNMWTTSNIVLIDSYWCLWEFDIFSQHWGMLHYATIWSCDYWPQVGKLCVHAINNSNYFECDYKAHDFVSMKGATFQSVIVGGVGWSNMEGPHVYLCTMSSFACWWPSRFIFGNCSYCITSYVVWAIY
jgi:hypothetical protein